VAEEFIAEDTLHADFTHVAIPGGFDYLAESCIHHADRGPQYASVAYRELLATSWPDRLDEPPRQSVRQRQCRGRSRRLHSAVGYLNPM
jgi:hypothetical protein